MGKEKKKSIARFGGHCIGFLIHTTVLRLQGRDKSGCGKGRERWSR